jgi:hypothetical protein
MGKRFRYLIIIILFSFSFCNNTKTNETIHKELCLDSLLTQKEGYVKIRLRQLKSGHLILYATINKVKGRFILDTGSSRSIIDRKHKKKFRLNTKTTKKIAKTAGGSQLKMMISSENTLGFNNLIINNFNVSLVNLNHINYSFKKMGIIEVDGIIGSDLLKSRKCIIDYASLTLYLMK